MDVHAVQWPSQRQHIQHAHQPVANTKPSPATNAHPSAHVRRQQQPRVRLLHPAPSMQPQLLLGDGCHAKQHSDDEKPSALPCSYSTYSDSTLRTSAHLAANDKRTPSPVLCGHQGKAFRPKTMRTTGLSVHLSGVSAQATGTASQGQARHTRRHAEGNYSARACRTELAYVC